MLAEHLSQAHDAASRRAEKIDEQVAWIHKKVLNAQATRILDLGCGPGLYTSRLARWGHQCAGIDYSPAAIEYAAEKATREGLTCEYRRGDIRQVDYGSGHGLVMLLFGEFNVFRPADARAVLSRANEALADGGLLLLEPHTLAAVRQIGVQPRSWDTLESGLFSDRAHVLLQENHWDPTVSAATKRFYVVDAVTGEVTRHAVSYQAYTDEAYRALLVGHGFRDVELLPSITGKQDDSQAGLMAILARKS
jgi:SAM-dependent methyltransferase